MLGRDMPGFAGEGKCRAGFIPSRRVMARGGVNPALRFPFRGRVVWVDPAVVGIVPAAGVPIIGVGGSAPMGELDIPR
ncbi:MAG: hypothetical protein ACJATG_001858, partial [Dinoroseobacter sp.]